MEGATDKVAGKAREIKGRLTGDEEEEVRGKAQQFDGDAKHKAASAKRKTEGKVDELKGKIKQRMP